MKNIIVDAKTEHLDEVIGFLEEELEESASMKVLFQIRLAVEEIFVNIASYSYGEEGGKAEVRLEVEGNPAKAVISFIDSGVPYNPLEKEDPDITLGLEDRGIGGMGIYLVKKTMDSMDYEYKDGCNVLTITKGLA